MFRILSTKTASHRSIKQNLLSKLSYLNAPLLIRRWFTDDIKSDPSTPEVEEASEQVRKIASTLHDMPNPTNTPPTKSVVAADEAKFIFDKVWDKLEKEIGQENLRFPSEIIWLMGAPGSGKGTNAPAISKARGITNRPIVMSHLLKDPEVMKLIDRAEMVNDEMVFNLLLKTLVKSDVSSGVIVDGFPRTDIQVEILKLFYDKLMALRATYSKTSLRDYFRKPVFRIVVLFIDESESVRRQVKRGRQVRHHNELVRISGEGELLKERATDFDEKLIRARYKVFTQHFGALSRLKKMFPFHLVHSVGPIEEVMRNVFKEFEYQSSLELDHETYESIEHIPIANQVGKHARQELIRRLEKYQAYEIDLFKEAIGLIEKEFVPVIKRHAISGATKVRIPKNQISQNRILDMVMDVLSERGFIVSADCTKIVVPLRVNSDTWDIVTKTEYTYIFDIKFPRNQIRGVAVESDLVLRDLANDVSSTEISNK